MLLGRSGAEVTAQLDQAACWQVLQEQSAQLQLEQLSAQFAHSHLAWLQVLQLQSSHVQVAHESWQWLHWHAVHSS